MTAADLGITVAEVCTIQVIPRKVVKIRYTFTSSVPSCDSSLEIILRHIIHRYLEILSAKDIAIGKAKLIMQAMLLVNQHISKF